MYFIPTHGLHEQELGEEEKGEAPWGKRHEGPKCDFYRLETRSPKTLKGSLYRVTH